MTTDKLKCVSCGCSEGEFHRPNCGIYMLRVGPPGERIRFQPNKQDDTVNWNEIVRKAVTSGPIVKPEPLDVHSCLDEVIGILEKEHMLAREAGTESWEDELYYAWKALRKLKEARDG